MFNNTSFDMLKQNSYSLLCANFKKSSFLFAFFMANLLLALYIKSNWILKIVRIFLYNVWYQLQFFKSLIHFKALWFNPGFVFLTIVKENQFVIAANVNGDATWCIPKFKLKTRMVPLYDYVITCYKHWFASIFYWSSLPL